mgnify:CR=1 FL=1
MKAAKEEVVPVSEVKATPERQEFKVLDKIDLSQIEGNTNLYLKWLFNMWLSAAIGEELLFRGFVFSQLQRVIGNKKYLIILFSAILFSLPHLYQGISGLIMTFLFGIIFAFIGWCIR